MQHVFGRRETVSQGRARDPKHVIVDYQGSRLGSRDHLRGGSQYHLSLPLSQPSQIAEKAGRIIICTTTGFSCTERKKTMVCSTQKKKPLFREQYSRGGTHNLGVHSRAVKSCPKRVAISSTASSRLQLHVDDFRFLS